VTKDEFERQFEVLAEEYGPKARALVRKIGVACVAAGLSDDGLTCTEEGRWSKYVWRTPEPGPEQDGIEIAVCLCDVPAHRALEVHDGFGVAFVLMVIDPQGKVLGSYWPDGSGHLIGDGRAAWDWVDARDAAQVRDRWEELAEVAVAEVTELLRAEQRN
jgi:hypothetical protein